MTIRIDKSVLGGNAIQTVSGTAPAAPITGAFWYDTGAAALKVWNGSAWVAAGGGAVTSVADTATIDLTLAAGVLTGAVVAPLSVANGGTGTTNLGANGALVTAGSGVPSAATGTTGQVLRATAGPPAFGALDLASAAAVTGTLPPARLGSGTPSATTYLRGDSTWATPAGGGGGTDTHTVATSPPASPVAGDVWLDTTAVAADMATQAELNAEKPVRVLSYQAGDLLAGAMAANTWTDVCANQSFTVPSATAQYAIFLRMALVAQAAAAGQLLTRWLFNGGAQIVVGSGGMIPIANGWGTLGAQAFWLPPAFLGVGAATIRLQMLSISAATVYCRPVSQPTLENFNLAVVQMCS